ncbi:VanZ family protein [Pseudoflavitalea sp. G-6-1-2]|uniref:VanZ family protein n=1 Tax=Pseudoflavitalea sp. G-6-1-2 TaxID=2728841 RepID=UPI00146DE69F|nr:VanZ family protein [Pseudoflavitalea sp. G-6-1-2]NML20389.1 VanZ family protein [Pseudoflavitalea sp. G-6-1-2]
MKKITENLFVPLAWTIAVQVLLCLPGSTISGIPGPKIPHFDKFVHFILFGVLGVLWSYYAWAKKKSGLNVAKWFRLVFLAVVANGIVLEIIQYCFIPDRSFDWWDILADTAGAAVAWAICYFKLLKIN